MHMHVVFGGRGLSMRRQFVLDKKSRPALGGTGGTRAGNRSLVVREAISAIRCHGGLLEESTPIQGLYKDDERRLQRIFREGRVLYAGRR